MSNWLTIIIVLLIVVILADGFRRSYNARQNRLDLSPSLSKRSKKGDDEGSELGEPISGEFPNGGARVIGQRDTGRAQVRARASVQEKKPGKQNAAKDKRDSRRGGSQRNPEQAHLNLETSVPILMDSVRSEPSEANHAADERIEPTFSARDSISSRGALDDGKDDAHFAAETDYEDGEIFDEDIADDDAVDEEDYDEEDEGYEDDYEDDESEEDDDDEVKPAAQTQPEEVFIINVMAHKGKFFQGTDLLDATLKCGLRYGNMDIFHRYSNTKGEGVLLFSMANMVKPGTFDLDAMDDFETPGVSLFMTLPIDADSMKSFDLMVDTANILAEALNGELKDEQRSAMTRQTIEHCRQRISDFERKKLFRRAK